MQTPPPSPDSLSCVIPEPASRKLIVVSNRLPVTMKRAADGSWDYRQSSGGLVTSMGGLTRETESLWYGWPGVEMEPEETTEVTKYLKEKHKAVPVFMNKQLAHKHYNGFSNSTLWPLLHYQSGLIAFHTCDWEAYYEVNRKFATQIAAEAANGDLVWVHDYHLMLLPAMLAEEAAKQGKTLTTGFFLHTPFPSGDMFKVLPVWKELLTSLVHCDLIGFHTKSYEDNFKRTCVDLLHAKEQSSGLEFHGKLVRLGIFPVGIEPKQFTETLEKPAVKARVASLNQQNQGRKVIVGVDRVDYIKGIPQKLNALDQFLDQHPEWVGKVVMVQVAIPSREEVKEYSDLANTLHEEVHRINLKHGSKGYQPINLMHCSVPFEELVALYATSDICLVSSIRDGMNLVSYEYIASQKERQGVLCLSEFAGAAEQLKGSLLFNPWDPAAMVSAIYKAVTMSPRQREINYKKSVTFVEANTSAAWGQSFLTALKKADQSVPLHLKTQLPKAVVEQVYSKSELPKVRSTIFRCNSAF